MNTNLNMIETRTNGNNGANTAVINSMVLQQLLATKDEAQAAEFEQVTGWSWLSACTTAMEADPSMTVATIETAETNDEFAARFERETGWSYGDAVDMAAECRRDDRFFGGRRFRSNRASKLSFADKFARETGWNLGDAIDMAAELRREDRLFGGSRSNYLN